MSKRETGLGENRIQHKQLVAEERQYTENQPIDGIQAPVNPLTIQVDSGGQLYFNIQGKIFPCHEENPIESARNLARNKKGIVFLFGVGLGFEWMSLLEDITDESYVVAMEPEASFSLLSEHSVWDMVKETEREYATFTTIIPGDELEYTDFHLFIPWQKIEFVHLLHTPGYDKAFPHEYKAFLEKIKNEMYMKTVDQRTFLYALNTWQENFIQNLSFLTKSLSYQHFYDIFNIPIPGIVVSAGPSLDKNIHLLDKMKDKAFIICGYTAWKALKKAGIQPDLLIAIDGKQLSVESRAMNLDIPLGFSLHLDNDLLSKLENRDNNQKMEGNELEPEIPMVPITPKTTGIYMPNFLDPLAQRLGIKPLESGGSVACVITSFLKSMGCDPIVFVGQDLAFDGSQSHARGTDYEEKPLEVAAENKMMIEGIDRPVCTTQSLYSFLLWFEKYIALHPETTFIDATEGGARIKGTATATLESLMEQYPDIPEQKNKFIEILDTKDSVLTKKALDNMFVACLAELTTYIPLWEEGLEIISDIERNQGDLSAQLNRLDEIDAVYTQWDMARLFLHLSLQKTQFTMLQSFMKEDNVLGENKILYRDLLKQGKWMQQELIGVLNRL